MDSEQFEAAIGATDRKPSTKAVLRDNLITH
jgi:hypothetical protein